MGLLGYLAPALALVLMSTAAAGQPAKADRVLIFAAASLKTALDEFAALPAVKAEASPVISYAATPALVRQLEQGAPAHIFMSADTDWMDEASNKKLVRSETRVDLLTNRLVLVGRKGSGLGPVDIGPGVDLARLIGNGRIAVGQVESVPAGRYAKAALERLGAWEQVRGRLAEAENVRVALRFVALGEAPLGIVYRTDAAAEPDVEVLGAFPESSHQRIVYPVALTTTPSAAAQRLLVLLRARAARDVFERHGFGMVE